MNRSKKDDDKYCLSLWIIWIMTLMFGFIGWAVIGFIEGNISVVLK